MTSRHELLGRVHDAAKKVWPLTNVKILYGPSHCFIWDADEDQCLLCAVTLERAERAVVAMLAESADETYQRAERAEKRLRLLKEQMLTWVRRYRPRLPMSAMLELDALFGEKQSDGPAQ